jgi:hypothetical protein
LHPALLHAVPAFIATLLVAVSAWLAGHGRRGLSSLAGVVTVVALLGLPSPDFAYFLLQGPWHVGTTLWCLLAFAGLSRKSTWWGWIASVVFLSAGLLGDAMTVMIGLIPLLASGIVAICHHRSFRAGARTLAAAAGSVGVALLVRAAAVSVGTFSLVNRNVPITSAQIEWNARHLGPLLVALLGTGTLNIGVSAGPLLLQVLHLVGVLAVGAGVGSALVGLARRLIRPEPLVAGTFPAVNLDDLLVLAFFSDLATFVLVSPTSNANYERYLFPVVIVGAILAGRFVGRAAPAIRGQWYGRAAGVGAVVTVLAFGLDAGSVAAAPVPSQPAVSLASFLEHHHLTKGIGDYWSSSIVTVESHGAVVVRPVTNNAMGVLLRYDRQSSSAWYADEGFQFFVYDTSRPWRKVNVTSATATFGRPMHSYEVGTYRVLVWSHLVSVAPGLPSQPDPIRLFWRL